MSSKQLSVQRPTGLAARRSKRHALRASVVAVLLLAGCGTQRTPDHYTASVGTNFIQACVAQSKTQLSGSTSKCTCTYNEIKKSIKFSRFKQINSAMTEKPAALPSDITNILDNCQAGGESSGQSTSDATTTTAG